MLQRKIRRLDLKIFLHKARRLRTRKRMRIIERIPLLEIIFEIRAIGNMSPVPDARAPGATG